MKATVRQPEPELELERVLPGGAPAPGIGHLGVAQVSAAGKSSAGNAHSLGGNLANPGRMKAHAENAPGETI